MDDATHATHERPFDVSRHETGQSRRVTDFILGWWNADSLGGFDLSDIFAVDQVIARDTATIVRGLAEAPVADRGPHPALAAGGVGVYGPNRLTLTR